MIFNSSIFALFFPIVFFVHWGLSGVVARRTWLLLASYVFYAWWDWRLLGLIMGVTLLAYLAARRLERDGPEAKGVLAASVVLLLGVLGLFKYHGFFLESLAPLLEALGLAEDWFLVEIVLPVGISFYVFQAISYVVDVSRKTLPAERSLPVLALYIAFFPQLIAGPIVRAKGMLSQLHQDRRLSWRMAMMGVRLFVLGFVYKVAVADNLAVWVDPVFADPIRYDRLSLLWASVAFHGQIYFDFAGYSTMAVGLALLLGYRVPRNFRHPYGASSPAEFWHRWHITLSRWFRDYLYIPLGGNRHGRARTLVNLMLTMSLAGLWHGAAWTFVLWGAAHGAALIVHRLIRRIRPKRVGWLTMGLGLLATQAFVLAAWTSFRANGFGDLMVLWEGMLGLSPTGAESLPAVAALAILPVLVDHMVGAFNRWRHRRGAGSLRLPVFVYGMVLGVVLAATLLIAPLSSPPFIYFQF